jgi:formylglycine-generating enzyme required for sulfatase activity
LTIRRLTLGAFLLCGLAAAACPSERDRYPVSRSKDASDDRIPDGPATAEAAAEREATIADVRTGPTPIDVGSPEPFDASGCVHPPVERDCRDGYCRIPAGCFVMGSPETEWYRGSRSEERLRVTLTHDFLIGEHEVTQAEWTAAGLDNPSGKMDDGTGDCLAPECPVGNVTWIEALAFANLLSQRHDPPLPPCYELTGCVKSLGDGLVCNDFKPTAATLYDCAGFRLPTAAEWEYAARAGTRTAFYGGDITAYPTLDAYPDAALEQIGWYRYNAGGSTHPVGLLAPNGFGLYDTAGNADEWVNDHYTGLPPQQQTDPGATLNLEPPRAVRGGRFNSLSVNCRAASALPASFWARGPGGGFRLARTLK